MEGTERHPGRGVAGLGWPREAAGRECRLRDACQSAHRSAGAVVISPVDQAMFLRKFEQLPFDHSERACRNPRHEGHDPTRAARPDHVAIWNEKRGHAVELDGVQPIDEELLCSVEAPNSRGRRVGHDTPPTNSAGKNDSRHKHRHARYFLTAFRGQVSQNFHVITRAGYHFRQLTLRQRTPLPLQFYASSDTSPRLAQQQTGQQREREDQHDRLGQVSRHHLSPSVSPSITSRRSALRTCFAASARTAAPRGKRSASVCSVDMPRRSQVKAAASSACADISSAFVDVRSIRGAS